jgi:hypothetical protein
MKMYLTKRALYKVLDNFRQPSSSLKFLQYLHNSILTHKNVNSSKIVSNLIVKNIKMIFLALTFDRI